MAELQVMRLCTPLSCREQIYNYTPIDEFLGTDEQAIINQLVKCSNHQRQEIKLKYKVMYGRVCEGQLAVGKGYIQSIIQSFLGSCTLLAVLFYKDLIKDLKSELAGNFENAVVWFMEDKSVFDAKCLRQAMKGVGTDEEALIEILCTRTNEEIQQIKRAYKEGKGLGL